VGGDRDLTSGGGPPLRHAKLSGRAPHRQHPHGSGSYFAQSGKPAALAGRFWAVEPVEPREPVPLAELDGEVPLAPLPVDPLVEPSEPVPLPELFEAEVLEPEVFDDEAPLVPLPIEPMLPVEPVELLLFNPEVLLLLALLPVPGVLPV
jgi:hypothetical protein